MARTRIEGGAKEPLAGPGASRGRAVAIAAISVLALTALAVGAWWVVSRGAVAGPDAQQRAELEALDTRLDAVNAAITPIAAAFTSEASSSVIDVDSYRDRIAAARRLVDDTNDIEVTDGEALKVRDLILTGGSQVLTGMDLALDALVSDEASATEPAASQVEAGLDSLQQARQLLDSLMSGTAPAPDADPTVGLGQ